MFKVTAGAETLAKPAEPTLTEPEPEPEPEPEGCPWLWGFHVNAFGPQSDVGLEAATQPGICWLELSAGVGVRKRFNAFEATPIANVEARTGMRVFPVTLRGRIWFFETHSLIADVGLGLMRYRFNGTEPAFPFEYERTGTTLAGFFGAGYGYRSPSSPFRYGILLGGVFQNGSLDDSDVTAPNTPGAVVRALGADLDTQTDAQKKPQLYGEVSLGLLF